MKNFQTGHLMLIARNKLLMIGLAFAVMDMVISGVSFADGGAMEAIYVSLAMIFVAQAIMFLFLLMMGFWNGIIATALFYIVFSSFSWVMFFVSLYILGDFFKHKFIDTSTSWNGVGIFILILVLSYLVCLIFPLWVTGLFDRKIKSAIGWSEPEKPGNPPREPNP